MIILKTNFGDIGIELDFENTPNTAKNFLQYAREGFYKGTIFHRIIDGFMIQGGGFDEGMQPKSAGQPIHNEGYKGNHNASYTVSMARTSDPHSASSQFFINVADNSFLDFKSETGQGWGYCAFARVISGMDVVDEIKKVATTSRNGHQDVPVEPVMIADVVVNEDHDKSLGH